MDTAIIEVAVTTLIFAGALLIYAPVIALAWRRLLPGLSPSARRLALCLLCAQIAIVLAAIFYRPSSWYSRWLVQLHEEGNLPATLASIQLALMAGAALAIALQAKAKPRWQRLYYVGITASFALLAVDEFAMLHESHLGSYFVWLGAALVLTTLAVARQTPGRARLWHGCFVAGLAVSALGAFVFERIPPACDRLFFLQLDRCLFFFYWEECFEFLGIWLALVALLGALSQASTPSRRVWRLLFMLPFAWIALLAAHSLAPRLEWRLFAQPAAVDFASGTRLTGFSLERSHDSLALRLYSSARQERYRGSGFSLHLVDQVDGRSAAQVDAFPSYEHGFWLFGQDEVTVFLALLKLEIPPDAPANRALWIVLTQWRSDRDNYHPTRILVSDLPLLSETQVILGELALPDEKSAMTSPPLAIFSNGFALQSFELPEIAKAGDALPITFTWRSDIDSDADHIQFLHLRHDDTGEYVVYDQLPLGARLPTRLWYAGLLDSETWSVPLPADLQPGSYTVFTGLYRVMDKERVPVADAEGKDWLDARVAIGSLSIANAKAGTGGG